MIRLTGLLLAFVLLTPSLFFAQASGLGIYNANKQAQAQAQAQSQSQATKVNVTNSSNVERPLVLSPASSSVEIPLETTGKTFSHIKLVKCNRWRGSSLYQDIYSYQAMQNLLSGLTMLPIMNPYEVNKKTAKKNPTFLQDVKEEGALYLYVLQSRGRGDDKNTLVLLRDWENNIVYKATHVNVSLVDCLSFTMVL